jgi:putative transposase
MTNTEEKPKIQEIMPSAEKVAAELATAKSMDDFFGKDGIFARLFSKTLEQMLEAELDAHLGYEKYEAKGRNSGNSRNGHTSKKVRSGEGETEIRVPRDRNGEFEPQIVKRHERNTNELEDKIIAMYARGMSVRDIQETLNELYGMEVAPATISAVTDKVWGLVEAWQNRPLAAIYPLIWLDAIHIKIRREGRIETVAVYIILGVDLEGQRDVLGHWIGDGAEGANYWLSVLSDLQARGVRDVLIASIDGLAGFSEAIHSLFPRAEVQRCIVHQIRASLKYIVWKDRKEFVADLKRVYQAPTREAAEASLANLAEKWGSRYPMAVKSWQAHWPELSAYFEYPQDIRRLMYTTNTVEGYNRQIRKITKSKGAFPTTESVRKLLFLITQDITKSWTAPIQNWALILNQLTIRFGDRLNP